MESARTLFYENTLQYLYNSCRRILMCRQKRWMCSSLISIIFISNSQLLTIAGKVLLRLFASESLDTFFLAIHTICDEYRFPLSEFSQCQVDC